MSLTVETKNVIDCSHYSWMKLGKVLIMWTLYPNCLNQKRCWCVLQNPYCDMSHLLLWGCVFYFIHDLLVVRFNYLILDVRFILIFNVHGIWTWKPSDRLIFLTFEFQTSPLSNIYVSFKNLVQYQLVWHLIGKLVFIRRVSIDRGYWPTTGGMILKIHLIAQQLRDNFNDSINALIINNAANICSNSS